MLHLLPAVLALLPGAALGQTAATSPALDFAAYSAQYAQPAFFGDNNQAFLARLKLLDSLPAGSKAQIATFTFDNGVVTRTLAHHLCRTARKGIAVELLVDAKSGSLAGQTNAWNESDDAKTQEEIYQYLANCGVKVHVHNDIQDFILALGSHLPNFMGHPDFNGRSVDPLTLYLRVLQVSGRLSGLVEGAARAAGAPVSAADMVANLRDFALNLKDVMGKGDAFPIPAGPSRGSPGNGETAAAEKAMKAWHGLVNDPLWDQISDRQLGRTLESAMAQLQASTDDLGQAVYALRRYNRLNHRKLFLVESPGGAGCFFLGGRNLGDDYLSGQPTSYFDGDLLLCTHQGEEARKAFSQAKASFRDLLENRADGHYRLPNSDIPLRDIPARKGYAFQHLWAPEAQPDIPVEAYLKAANARPTERESLLPAISWADSRRIEPTAELADARGFTVLTSSLRPSEDQVKARLLELVGREKKEIYLETPYAVFDAEVRGALEAAMKRGVDFHLVTNGFFTSDGLSKISTILMNPWYRAMRKLYPGRFHMRTTSAHSSHMTHFKFAAFACQPGPNGERAFLLGSHNFHPRSGLSDREHALSWTAPGCAALAADSLVGSREKLYSGFPLRGHGTVLETFTDVSDELIRMSRGAYDKGEDLKIANHKNLAENMLTVLFERHAGARGETSYTLWAGNRIYLNLIPKLEKSGVFDLFAQLF